MTKPAGPIAAQEDAEEQAPVDDRFGLEVDDLHTRALQWSQLRGSRSGLVAWRFIRDLAGEPGKTLPL